MQIEKEKMQVEKGKEVNLIFLKEMFFLIFFVKIFAYVLFLLYLRSSRKRVPPKIRSHFAGHVLSIADIF